MCVGQNFTHGPGSKMKIFFLVRPSPWCSHPQTPTSDAVNVSPRIPLESTLLKMYTYFGIRTKYILEFSLDIDF